MYTGFFKTDGTLAGNKRDLYEKIRELPRHEQELVLRRYDYQLASGKYVPGVSTILDKITLPEPLLETRGFERFVLQPTSVEKSEVFAFYKRQQEAFWVVEEIDMGSDRASWERLNDGERHFVSMILAFFAFADGMVNENMADNFLFKVQDPEVRAYYTQQMLIETIHAETYTMLLNFYVTDPVRKEELFDAVNTIPCINKKATWAKRWLDDQNISIDMRIIAFSIIEGVFFSGCFCAIFWLKSRGLLPGLTHSNELISRDEGIHTDFACLLHNTLIANKVDELIVHDMFREAVEIEKEFICESLPVALIGMDSQSMSQYIEFVADRLLRELDYSTIFTATNPFPFMNLISLEGKTNFFEKKVSEYKTKKLDRKFSLTADF